MTIDDIKKEIESSELMQKPEVTDLFGLIFNLYENKRIYNTSLPSDGDMLLFQWGTYDWGNGKYFNLDLTRQVMDDFEDPDEQSDSMQQLSVALFFELNAENEVFKSGNMWCSSPNELDKLKHFIEDNDAYNWALERKPKSMEVLLTDV